MKGLAEFGRSTIVFPAARSPVCYFCGGGNPWFLCECEVARRSKPVYAGKDKLEFQILVRAGVPVITRCSAESMRAIRFVGALRIVEGREDFSLGSVLRGSVVDSVTSVTVNPEADDLSVTAPEVNVTRCAQCGGIFEPKRATGRYCSAVCRQKAHRGRADNS